MVRGPHDDQKREITAAITEAVVKIGKTTADQVHIVFQDVEKTTGAERQARQRLSRPGRIAGYQGID